MTRLSVSARRGFTLIELLVAMVLVGIVGVVLTRTLINMQRGSRAQSQRAVLQGNLRAGMALLPSELRELPGADIVTAQPDRIEYRAMRSTSSACLVSPLSVSIRSRLTFGYRDIQAGRDGLLIFFDNDEYDGADDGWNSYAISAVAVNGGVCPDGGQATVLTLAAPGIRPDSVLMVTGEPPVRSFEQMEFRNYQAADGRYWLGGRSVSAGGVIEPVLGPLTNDGLVLTYLDRNGNPTATPALIRSIGVVLRGETDAAISTGYDQMQIARDGLSARVRLRNAPAF